MALVGGEPHLRHTTTGLRVNGGIAEAKAASPPGTPLHRGAVPRPRARLPHHFGGLPTAIRTAPGRGEGFAALEAELEVRRARRRTRKPPADAEAATCCWPSRTSPSARVFTPRRRPRSPRRGGAAGERRGTRAVAGLSPRLPQPAALPRRACWPATQLDARRPATASAAFDPSWRPLRGDRATGRWTSNWGRFSTSSGRRSSGSTAGTCSSAATRRTAATAPRAHAGVPRRVQPQPRAAANVRSASHPHAPSALDRRPARVARRQRTPGALNDDRYVQVLRGMDLGLNERGRPRDRVRGCTETMIAGQSNVGSLEGTLISPRPWSWPSTTALTRKGPQDGPHTVLSSRSPGLTRSSTPSGSRCVS